MYVWFDFGEGEGGGGIREPRVPGPPRGGSGGNWPSRASRPAARSSALPTPGADATTPPVGFRYATLDQPALPSRLSERRLVG